MEQFLQYHKRIFAVMCMACGAAFAGLAAAGDAPWAPGFGAGAAAQLVKFACIDAAVVRKIALERRDAAATQLKATALSLALFGLAALAAHRWGGNMWALAAGIFLPRAVLVADAWIRPKLFEGE